MSSFITCWGGAGEVSGANFEFSGDFGRVLVDCGLIQGAKACEQENFEPFPYDPREIDALVITHAHLDHIGRIPKLVKSGFGGTIYSTLGTQKLAELMFEDAVELLSEEAARNGHEPLYNRRDVSQTFSLWKSFPYQQRIELPAGLSFIFRDAGHILGSAMVEFERRGVKAVFTGDLGNSPAPLLRPTEDLEGVSYLLMESVYGDRNHEPREVRDKNFREALVSTLERGGSVVIPAFSMERTQNILFALHGLSEKGSLPEVPVFVDSPLAIKVTQVYRNSLGEFNSEVQAEFKREGDIFSMPQIRFTRTPQESAEIHKVLGPKIILAGSGMSAGGRVTSHEKEYLSDPKSTILLVGYQSPGTLGRLLESGAREVEIEGRRLAARARVLNIRGFSAHKDSEHLLEFVEKTAGSLKKVLVAMGEPKASLFLVQRLREYLGVPAYYAERASPYEIDF